MAFPLPSQLVQDIEVDGGVKVHTVDEAAKAGRVGRLERKDPSGSPLGDPFWNWGCPTQQETSGKRSTTLMFEGHRESQ